MLNVLDSKLCYLNSTAESGFLFGEIISKTISNCFGLYNHKPELFEPDTINDVWAFDAKRQEKLYPAIVVWHSPSVTLRDDTTEQVRQSSQTCGWNNISTAAL